MMMMCIYQMNSNQLHKIKNIFMIHCFFLFIQLKWMFNLSIHVWYLIIVLITWQVSSWSNGQNDSKFVLWSEEDDSICFSDFDVDDDDPRRISEWRFNCATLKIHRCRKKQNNEFRSKRHTNTFHVKCRIAKRSNSFES